MAFKIVVALCALIAVAVSIPAAQGVPGGWGPPIAWGPFAAAAGPAAGPGGAAGAGANPWIPPWIASAPWYPQWTPCTTIGSTCLDCNNKLVCTKVGGLQRACTDPTLPYCNLGQCSATPTAECAPVAVPNDAGTV